MFTPFPEVDEILAVLIPAVQDILGSNLIGMYLDGSLATGDFDQASDIDFVVITSDEISPEVFQRLYRMHEEIMDLDARLAVELEGSYVAQRSARRYRPENPLMYPNIERGRGEKLKLVEHGVTWNIHRYLLREKGIVLLGPDPKTLIDPVTREDLHAGVNEILKVWAVNLIADPSLVTHQGYQSYIVLSLCRILYTLARGDVVSKATAWKWALENAPARFYGVIEAAWAGRVGSGGPADPAEVSQTLDFASYTLDLAGTV